jgi:hypothetical protein
MAQVVSCQPFTMEAQVSPCGIYGGQSAIGTGFSPNSLVPLSVSFHHGCPYSYIIWGMNNRCNGVSSSETCSHLIELSGGTWWTTDVVR